MQIIFRCRDWCERCNHEFQHPPIPSTLPTCPTQDRSSLWTPHLLLVHMHMVMIHTSLAHLIRPSNCSSQPAHIINISIQNRFRQPIFIDVEHNPPGTRLKRKTQSSSYDSGCFFFNLVHFQLAERKTDLQFKYQHPRLLIRELTNLRYPPACNPFECSFHYLLKEWSIFQNPPAKLYTSLWSARLCIQHR